MTINSVKERKTIPIHPAKVEFSGCRNFTDKAAPKPIITAFIAKHILNANGEKP